MKGEEKISFVEIVKLLLVYLDLYVHRLYHFVPIIDCHCCRCRRHVRNMYLCNFRLVLLFLSRTYILRHFPYYYHFVIRSSHFME